MCVLQSNPTVVYGLFLKGKRNCSNDEITIKETKINSPYNTYLHKGLPIGAICNPGKASLLAAANPIKTKDMYFMGNDKHHIFAKTFAQHKRNIKLVRKNAERPC